MKRLCSAVRHKLAGSRGESITEVLVAVLISSVALVMLANNVNVPAFVLVGVGIIIDIEIRVQGFVAQRAVQIVVRIVHVEIAPLPASAESVPAQTVVSANFADIDQVVVLAERRAAEGIALQLGHFPLQHRHPQRIGANRVALHRACISQHDESIQRIA